MIWVPVFRDTDRGTYKYLTPPTVYIANEIDRDVFTAICKKNYRDTPSLFYPLLYYIRVVRFKLTAGTLI